MADLQAGLSAFKFGAIYAWTGSVSIMLTLGTLTIVANTGVSYANNVGWDLYEWWNTAPRPPRPRPRRSASPRPERAIRE